MYRLGLGNRTARYASRYIRRYGDRGEFQDVNAVTTGPHWNGHKPLPFYVNLRLNYYDQLIKPSIFKSVGFKLIFDMLTHT